MHQFFSHVCGQIHIWCLGGVSLPFCQRCTGLYLGGLYSLILIIVFRPSPSARLLGVHLLLLLQMVPFGFHLVPYGAILRTITGQLFAYGLTYCLCVNLFAELNLWPASRRDYGLPYALWALAGAPLLLTAIRFGGIATASMLAWMGVAGFIAYAGLAAANVAILAFRCWQMLQHYSHWIFLKAEP